MEGRKKISAEAIIIVIVLIIIIAVVVHIQLNKKEPIVYGTVEAGSRIENMFINDYKTYKRFLARANIKDTLVMNYKQYSVKERYTEEFFENNKLAIITVSEDDSKEFIHDISDVIYNEERTEVTIKYVAKTDGYAGQLTRSWNISMIVELEPTVINVNFVLDND